MVPRCSSWTKRKLAEGEGLIRSDNLYHLPPKLPVPVDDGAADHLLGRTLPSVVLTATDGTSINLASISGLATVLTFPRTGRPDQQPLVPDWNLIPGARGCTPQTCAFREYAAEFSALHCRIFALSAQDTAYRSEMAARLRLPFLVLSDSELKLATALHLPTMVVAGKTLLRRLAWVARDAVIDKVFYPVFPPDGNAASVLEWLIRRG
jgi:peroxiredoxin